MRRALVLGFILLSIGRAAAQPAEPPPPEPAPPPPVEDPAWTLYRDAFAALASEQRDAARGLLERITVEHPTHPLAARARGLVDRLQTTAPPPRAGSNLARGELLLFQTLHGVGVGGEICVLLDCNGTRPVAGALLAGAATGFGLSWLVTRNGIEPAHTQSLDSGTVWGLWNGLALYLLVEDQDDLDGKKTVGFMLGGQLAGILGGELLWQVARPTPGQIGFANSLGFWSGLVAFYLNGLAFSEEADLDRQVVAGTVLAATDIGLVAGVLLGGRLNMSRGRALLIDAGGLVGALAGMGLGALTEDATGFFSLSIAGTVGGLVIATLATRNWDVPAPAAALRITPVRGGAIVGVGGSF